MLGFSSGISLVACWTQCPSCFLSLIDDCVEILPERWDGPGISSVGSTGAGGISCRCSSDTAGREVAGGSGVSENLFCGKENSLDVGGLICLFRSWFVSLSTLMVDNGRDSE